ncbi:MAG: glycoside hydrolase family 31 protein [Bacteroidia bacterium]
MQEGKRSPQLLQKWELTAQGCVLYCPETVLEVRVYSDAILRFHFSPEGRFEETFSYALRLDGLLPAADRVFTVAEVADELHITTRLLSCHITRFLSISIYDRAGVLISTDEKGFHWEPDKEHGGNVIYCSRKIQEQESFFGLGDKPNRLNLRGHRFETWGSDMYGYERTTDPLYKNIPFFLGLHHGIGYGIFFDNSFRTRFDFGHERSDVCTFWSRGGEMNYYFIYGPELTSVVEHYAWLTGTPDLPPLWALGFQQSKWSYQPEEQVKQIAARLRKERIPCDVLHLDIDYMDGFRCFTWHPDRFPNPKRMIAELASDGFKTVVILDPGIKKDRNYAVYREGVEVGYFCRRADGPIMEGNVWPGPCYFPDFTSPEVRTWWSGLVERFMEAGMHGIWNDMNEPAVFGSGTFPIDTRHDYDGHPCSHRKAHNVYGMQMARATFHGIKDAIYPRRPFALSRSGFAGIQRYAAVWTGDNLSTWEHLWMANVQCQRLSISGVSFCGSDVGGFIGDCNGELLTRWVQMGVFHPLFRIHSSGDHADQEPWVFGEPFTSAIRKAVELRYKLLPYIYTTFWRHVETGTPMLRPIAFVDQADPQTHYRMDEFMLGPHLLVCPVLTPGAEGRPMYLPRGKWYNYWTDELIKGGEEFWTSSPLDKFPFFVQAGATVPMAPLMQYTGEKRIEVLDMHIYYSPTTCTSELYEDAGDYYDYELGNTMIRTFTLITSEEQIIIRQLRKGRYNSEYHSFCFHLHGFPFTPVEVREDRTKVRLRKQKTGKPFSFEADKNFEEIVISRTSSPAS